jgi:3'-5' exoribonuclease
MNITEQLRRKLAGAEMSWTEYQRALERYLYLGALNEKDPRPEASSPDNGSRQPSLF